MERNRIALITGAARGLGFAIAEALAAAGARVAIVDRDGAEAAARRLGDGHRGFTADLADSMAVTAMANAVAATMGSPTLLVHCAGIFPTTPLDTLSLDTWRQVFAVNVDAAMLLARSLAPGMRAAGWGRMVMIASGTIAIPRRDVAAYVASKMALVGLARALATDLGPDGITVNAIAPGFVPTEGTRAKFDRIDDLARSIAARQAIPRLATPDEIAAACAFLCSDGAAMITGQCWMVDGGWSRL